MKNAIPGQLLEVATAQQICHIKPGDELPEVSQKNNGLFVRCGSGLLGDMHNVIWSHAVSVQG
ncbi:hypothetical protein [Nissabacter archeti]|uniref:hypothetical protein n=1 Tax=Nissabacter archeti TaxID=1917880 RepID=UPI0011151151|nr:hypothetical protein [Nissabacter archeti]